jgi:hypothetical protein
MPFHRLESNLKCQHETCYLDLKDDIEKLRKHFVYNSNMLNDMVMSGIIYNHKHKNIPQNMK